jgi:hypothetical protein
VVSNSPTTIEAPTAPNGNPAVVIDTPAPSPAPSVIGIDTDMPSPAPYVITITSSPVSNDTPAPTVGGDHATDDGMADDFAGSDDATQEDEITTCKNNAVITSIDSEGANDVQITTQASNGACAILSDSTHMIYYPVPNFLGDDSCDYTLCVDSDESGELTCTEGTLNVKVVECPIWQPDTQSPVAGVDVPTMSPTCEYAVSTELKRCDTSQVTILH